MFRALSVLLGQRAFLLCVALFVVNHSLPEPSKTKPVGSKWDRVWENTISRVENRPTTRWLLAEAKKPGPAWSFSNPPNPFILLYRSLSYFSGMRPVYTLILLTNIFFILFLFELNTVLSRFVPPGTAAKATTLVVLLPTSVEMSLVSSFSLTCFLIMVVIHHMIENRWLMAGILFGILALSEPLVVALLPLIVYTFVYYQRHFFVSVVAQRAVIFLIPVALGIAWNWEGYANISSAIQSSSWYYLLNSTAGPDGITRTLVHSPLGVTIVIVLLAIGGVAAAIYNTTLIHKMIPLYTFFYLLFTSPYEELGTRAPLAGLCMEGVALVSGKPAIVTVHLLLIALGMFETAWIFKV